MAENNDFATGYAVGRDSQNGGGYGYCGYPVYAMPYGYGMNGGFGSGFGWGGSDLIALIVILALFGGGFGGFGGFGGRGTAGLATTNDVASGFSTSTILSNQRELQSSQDAGFAGVQQTLCQGFSGLNQSILQSSNAVERGFATTNYNMATGFSGLSSTIDKCCCDLKTMLLENRYLNEKQTCDILRGQTDSTRQILDYLTGEKIDTLNRKLAVAEGQISDMKNANYIISQVKEPCPIPSYLVPNPNCCYNYGVGYSYGGFPYGATGTGTCTSIQ